MQERTLKLSASLKVRVIQILSLNTPQAPSCEGCRKPIWTNLSHVNKADFGYSGGVLRKEEGKIGWQIIDSKAQLLSSSSRFKRHSDRCCQSTQDIFYEKVASSLHDTLELLPSTKFRILFQKNWDRGTDIVSSYKLQITKVQPQSQVYSETVQNKSDVTGNTEMTRKTRNPWLWRSHSMVGLSQGSLTHLKFIPKKSRKLSFFFLFKDKVVYFLTCD